MLLRSAVSELLSILVIILTIAHLVSSDAASQSDETDHFGTLHYRSYFHVGGRTVNVSTPSYGTGLVSTEQIYVERLTPAQILHSTPVILWTGLGQTGASWLNTPDKRPGWAEHFLSAGYEVYIADQPARGRSPLLPPPFNDTIVSQGVVTASYASRYWTATQSFPNQSWPQASLHTQWPGSGLGDSTIFTAFMAAQVPSLLNQTTSETLSRVALTALLTHLNHPSILLTHSQGGPHGWSVADSVPHLLKAIIAIEPQGPPFVNQVIASSGPGVVRPWGLTQTPLRYSPALPNPDTLALSNRTVPPDREGRSECVLQVLPARRLVGLAGVKVLVVTGEAGYHAVYDWCTVAFLREAGVDVDWIDLPDVGVLGNGHFMFLERNSEDIWGLVGAWLERLGL